MARDWDAELIVTPELAARLVDEQFPELRPAEAVLFASGFDNTAYLINDAYLFRFPRRAVAVPLLETEARVLPALREYAQYVDVGIPQPRWVAKPSSLYPWMFSGYPKLSGRAAWNLFLDDRQRGDLTNSIADFLKQTHSLKREAVDSLGLQPDGIGKLNLHTRLPLLQKYFAEFPMRNLPFAASDFSYIIESVCRWTDRLSRKTLVHGDFHAGNFLLDHDNKFCAVVDWGDVHIGDPAVDLSCVHAFLPQQFHHDFRQRYGDIDEATWDFARFRALYVATVVLFYGQDNQLEHAIREGTTALRFLAGGQSSA